MFHYIESMTNFESPQIEACIFDLDGVIVDTAKYHFKAWQKMANALGIEFSHEQNENLKGVSRMESLDYILQLGQIQQTDEEKLALATQKNEDYILSIKNLDQSEILPGVSTFLQSLKDQKIKIALGSSSKNAQTILNKLDLTQFFEVIVDGTKTTRSKPDPQVFEMGAALMHSAPERTVVFEDALKGVEAALRGGFKCIGVGDRAILKEAHHVISGFEKFTVTDMKDIFESQNLKTN